MVRTYSEALTAGMKGRDAAQHALNARTQTEAVEVPSEPIVISDALPVRTSKTFATSKTRSSERLTTTGLEEPRWTLREIAQSRVCASICPRSAGSMSVCCRPLASSECGGHTGADRQECDRSHVRAVADAPRRRASPPVISEGDPLRDPARWRAYHRAATVRPLT